MVTMRRLSVKAITQASEKNTHTNQPSAGMPRLLTPPQTAFGGRFPFSSAFYSYSSSNHNQLGDRDLICCHSSSRLISDDRRVHELLRS